MDTVYDLWGLAEFTCSRQNLVIGRTGVQHREIWSSPIWWIKKI